MILFKIGKLHKELYRNPREFKLSRDRIPAGTTITCILSGRADLVCVSQHQKTQNYILFNFFNKVSVIKYILSRYTLTNEVQVIEGK